MNTLNFLALGFEVGQERSGLRDSYEYARQFFSYLQNYGVQIRDQGQIIHHDPSHAKIHDPGQVELLNWSPYEQAYKKIQDLLLKNETLLNWGGDHSVALATVGAFCSRFPEGTVIWIDAHGDINLPQHSLSGNLHGMPLSILMNLQNIANESFPWIQKHLQPHQLIYVGVRDLDPFEEETIQDLGIQAYTTADVRKKGMAKVAQEILEKVAHRPLHVSFDIDSLDPVLAPATGVPVTEGLNIAEVTYLGQTLAKNQNLRSVDIVEINPAIGNPDQVWKTYFSAFRFLLSLINSNSLSVVSLQESDAALEPFAPGVIR